MFDNHTYPRDRKIVTTWQDHMSYGVQIASRCGAKVREGGGAKIHRSEGRGGGGKDQKKKKKDDTCFNKRAGLPLASEDEKRSKRTGDGSGHAGSLRDARRNLTDSLERQSGRQAGGHLSGAILATFVPANDKCDFTSRVALKEKWGEGAGWEWSVRCGGTDQRRDLPDDLNFVKSTLEKDRYLGSTHAISIAALARSAKMPRTGRCYVAQHDEARLFISPEVGGMGRGGGMGWNFTREARLSSTM